MNHILHSPDAHRVQCRRHFTATQCILRAVTFAITSIGKMTFLPSGGQTLHVLILKRAKIFELAKESLLVVFLLHIEADPQPKLNRIAENNSLVCLIGSGM